MLSYFSYMLVSLVVLSFIVISVQTMYKRRWLMFCYILCMLSMPLLVIISAQMLCIVEMITVDVGNKEGCRSEVGTCDQYAGSTLYLVHCRHSST